MPVIAGANVYIILILDGTLDRQFNKYNIIEEKALSNTVGGQEFWDAPLFYTKKGHNSPSLTIYYIFFVHYL